MFRLNATLAVYLHREPIDFRKNINGLAALVEHDLALDPFADALYVFGNRRRDRIKILGWSRSGFWLLQKRLESERFIWPATLSGWWTSAYSNCTGCSKASIWRPSASAMPRNNNAMLRRLNATPHRPTAIH